LVFRSAQIRIVVGLPSDSVSGRPDSPVCSLVDAGVAHGDQPVIEVDDIQHLLDAFTAESRTFDLRPDDSVLTEPDTGVGAGDSAASTKK
jgi:hypothetical protein